MTKRQQYFWIVHIVKLIVLSYLTGRNIDKYVCFNQAVCSLTEERFITECHLER